MGHCAVCDRYEETVMAGEDAATLAPCDDYEMTEAFREWMVARMRDEVMGQINGTGLDRMAILRSKE